MISPAPRSEVYSQSFSLTAEGTSKGLGRAGDHDTLSVLVRAPRSINLSASHPACVFWLSGRTSRPNPAAEWAAIWMLRRAVGSLRPTVLANWVGRTTFTQFLRSIAPGPQMRSRQGRFRSPQIRAPPHTRTKQESSDTDRMLLSCSSCYPLTLHHHGRECW